MTYHPIADPKIDDLVCGTYSEDWAASIRKIEQLVAASNARKVCELLTASEGWRERVVAAKIIAAFGLVDLIKPLISTFSSNAQSYTARAFAKLIITTATLDLRHDLLEELRVRCPDTSYGRHMIEMIDDVSNTG